jgi:hypothetical protein
MLPGFTPALFRQAAAGADAFTVLLLHCDTTGSPAMLDYSPKNRGYSTQVASGAIQSTAQKKFGVASALLSGNGAFTFPHSSDFEFGSGDFTIEWFEYRTGGGCAIARDFTNTYAPFFLSYYSGGNLLCYMSSTGSSWDVSNGRNAFGAATLNAWVHLAITRSGTTFRTFKNGTQVDTWTSSASLLARTTPFCVGGCQSGSYYGGYIDELRVSKGVARWTASFTAPAAPYDPATQPSPPTMPQQFIILSSGSSWVVPADFTPTKNTIECYGGGGGGGGGLTNGTDAAGGAGGGGGACAVITNRSLSGTVSYSIGAAGTGGAATTGNGGTGGDTWFINTGTVLAKGGTGGAVANSSGSVSEGIGGAAASSVGTTKFNGGSGGQSGGWTGQAGGSQGAAGGGGGSSAGPTSAGNAGKMWTQGGTGGASVGGASGKGGDAVAGINGVPGNNGGNYGGGGGGGGAYFSTAYAGGAGSPGGIRILYGG